MADVLAVRDGHRAQRWALLIQEEHRIRCFLNPDTDFSLPSRGIWSALTVVYTDLPIVWIYPDIEGFDLHRAHD